MNVKTKIALQVSL